MHLRDFQTQIERTYLERDSQRSFERNFMWFAEEVGELSRAVLKNQGKQRLLEEFSDVLAWLATLATLQGIDLESAAQRYAHGCPKCGSSPCGCASNL